jgi:hypothetical protein
MQWARRAGKTAAGRGELLDSLAPLPISRLHEPDTGIGLCDNEPDTVVVAGGGAADGDVAGQRSSRGATMAMAVGTAHDLAGAEDLAGADDLTGHRGRGHRSGGEARRARAGEARGVDGEEKIEERTVFCVISGSGG